MENEINLKSFKDKSGILTPIEFGDLKFIPKRIFTISDVPKGTIRGNHAHYETEQLLICIRGKILVVLNDGKNKTETLIQEGEIKHIGKMIWDYQKFLTGNEIMIVKIGRAHV